MINKKIPLILIFLTVTSMADAIAESWEHKTRGYLSTKLSPYTRNDSKSLGFLARAQIEHSISFAESLDTVNQLRLQSNSINDDLSVKSRSDEKDYFDLYLGENYFRSKSDNWVFQVGYQEVVWGEAFGFNFADIVNPKDQRQTLFSDAGENRIPLMLINGKTFFSIGDLTGSAQLLYSPEPRFSKNLPVEIFAGDRFPQESLTVIKKKTPGFFKTHELGGKIASSYQGYDIALFGFSYLDRDPYYLLSSASLTNITLREEHNRVKSFGLSFAKTIYDFVLRSDAVITQDKLINYMENSALLSYSSDLFNALISLDTPSYFDYSGVFIFTTSTLKNVRANSFRNKNQQYAIGKITRSLKDDKSLEISYIHELELSGQSIQTILNWPFDGSTDLKFGGEFYFGNDQSNLARLKNCSNVFFSVKRYF